MTVLRGVLASAKGRTIVAASVILISGVAATFAARMLSDRMIASDMQRRFSADAADISTAIGDRLRTHAEVLVSMQGLHASIGRVDRAQFRRYIDVLDLARRYPGFQALQSLRQVGPEGLDAFVAEMRADNSVDASGQPEFTVRPSGKRTSYNVVEFVEPMRGNEDALGFDAGANPAQLNSLRRAAETGRIVATPPVKLVQDTSGGLGFILRAPIYRIGEPAQTTSQRVTALRGFVASVYRMNDLMRGVLDPRTLQQMQVQIVDRGYAKQTEGTLSGEPEDPASAATLMYNSLEPNLNLVAQIAEFAGIAADRSLVVGERVWRVVFSARPGSIYEVDRLVPNLVLASGVVISLLMALLTVVGLRSRQLSGNLNALDAEQRALVDNPLAGILFTEGRRILRGNRRMAELCGASPDELPGSTVDSPAGERSRQRSIRCSADDDPRQRHGDRGRIAPAPEGWIDPPDRRLWQAAGGRRPRRRRRDPLGYQGQDRRDADGRRASRACVQTAGVECKADVIAPGCRNPRQGDRIVDRTQWCPAILPGAG